MRNGTRGGVYARSPPASVGGFYETGGPPPVTSPGMFRPAGDEPLESGAGTLRAACPTLGRQERHITGGADDPNRCRSAIGQLNVPGSTITGAEEGADIMPPPSPHEPQAGPHAGSCIGAPQAGWQGWGCGAAQGAAPPPQGERNSMNDGRRQLFAPPKQLLQPGAAARLPRAITRHRVRHMIGISTTVGFEATRGRTRCVVRDDAYQTLAHDPQHGRTGETISPKNFPAGRGPRQRPCR